MAASRLNPSRLNPSRAWRSLLVLTSGAALLPAAWALAEPVGPEAGTTEYFRARFDQKEADEIVDDFKENTPLLEWAISDQRTFPTPEGGLAGGGRVASTSPFVTVFENFFSDEECEFLKHYKSGKLQPAMVVLSGDDWYGKQQETRSNEQHWLNPRDEKQVPLIRHLMKRLQRAARSPDEYVEALQIGRYNESKKYEGHLDTDPHHGVGRPATMITYLADVESGGDTLFPVSRKDCGAIWHKDPKNPEGEKVYGAKLCCNSPENDTADTVRVSPKKGRAVLFYNHFPDGTIDRKAHHIGCPVNKGVKWIAQRWFRFDPYNKVSYHDVEGWDPRYDGEAAPEERSKSRHLRVIGHNEPKLFLEEHFLTQPEWSQLAEVLRARLDESGQEQLRLSAEDVEGSALLKELTLRAHDLARLNPSGSGIRSTLRFKRLKQGAAEPPHLDTPPTDEAEEAQVATVNVYLQVAQKGGDFAFLRTPVVRTGTSCSGSDVEACCAEQDISKVRAAVGDAMLWFSFKQEGIVEEASKHIICPVLEGEIWIAEWAFLSKTPNVVRPANEDPNKKTQPAIDFLNMVPEELKIYWVPPQGGDETYMETLPEGPHASKSLDTYPGHVFHVRDLAGELIQKVTATAKDRQRHEIHRGTVEL